MNYYMTNEEYAEISARLEASIENLSFSDTEDPQDDQIKEYIPVASSIVDLENWKKFIEVRNKNDEVQLSIQEKFSEALNCLREATKEVKVEKIPEIQKESEEELSENFEIGHSEHISLNFDKIEESDSSLIVEIEKNTKENEIQKKKLEEKDNEQYEQRTMNEEDFLSRLFENWAKKELEMIKEAKNKELKRLEKIEKEKNERKNWLKQEEIKRAEKELAQQKMIEETQRINHKKAEELEKQKKERELMTIEEILSKALNDLIKISELQSFYAREHKNIIKEDDFRTESPGGKVSLTNHS